MTSQPSQCDITDFEDNSHDAGLKSISAEVASQYEQNYQALINQLCSDDPAVRMQLSGDQIRRMFRIHGYYMGKAQLSCLFKKDFKQYKGIQVQLGYITPTPRSAGRLVFTVRGQYRTTGVAPRDLDTPSIRAMNEGRPVPGRFGQVSSLVYLAGNEIEEQQPDPPAYPNPPYAPPAFT